ncbi:MAG: hypothetical protein JWL84_3285 [Rhodospirillales bacterium]|nr:hypothetical protein [Rhodospirillales bacterium]
MRRNEVLDRLRRDEALDLRAKISTGGKARGLASSEFDEARHHPNRQFLR